MSAFEKAGRIYLAGSKRSMKIIIEDGNSAFDETYFVSVRDIQKAINEPKFTATIVKVKNQEEI